VDVHPRAEPLYAGSGPVGVVLSHGFTGSPSSMRPWGEDLVEHGYRVAVPRLPGHGTRWQDMQRTGWQDWYAAVERAFLGLAEECSTVVVGGQSMGGCLALHLAARHGSAVAGVVLVNPALWSRDPRLLALPVLRHLVPSLPGIGNDVHKQPSDEWSYDRMPLHALFAMTRLWRVVSAELPTVTQPLLVFRSAQDHVLDGSSLRLLRSRVGSSDISEHVLHDSYHVATLDYDAPTLFATTRRFLDRLRPDRQAPTGTQAPQGEGSAR
jgi:carboxylesterase